MDDPMIYTSRGNLPIESLQYATRWEDSVDYIKFVEVYTFDGEVVRDRLHLRAPVGPQSAIAVLQALSGG